MTSIRSAFEESAALIASAGASFSYLAAVEEVAAAIVRAFQSGHKLLVFGNGGSSADAQHIAAEFVGRFAMDRPGLPAMALTSDPAFLTAWSNDHSFDTVFQRQIQSLGKPGDVAWGISTSGNSVNVVGGLKTAREAGLLTIGLTGGAGGRAAAFCDHLICAPSRETARVQEVHAVTYHAICAAVEAEMFGSISAPPAGDLRE